MKKLLLSSALLALAGWLCAGESYRFLMVSDTHFGSADSYYTGPEKEFRSNKDPERADKAMPLYRKLFSAMAAEPDVRFLIHGGDMIEGLAKDEAAHRAELGKAIALLNEYFKYPIHYIKGNHDDRGKGGNEAYRAVLLKEISRVEGRELAEANYSFHCGGDLFVCVDFSTNWPVFLKKTLAEEKTKPRYVFLVIHFNVMPFPFTKMIRAMKLLSGYDAIILCGHSHRNMLLQYRRGDTSVAQLTVATVVQPQEVQNRVRRMEDDLAAFKAGFRKTRLKKEAQIACFDAEWEPYLTAYRGARGGAGYAKIEVSDAEVKAVFQSADLKRKPVVFQLKPGPDAVPAQK